MDGQEKPVPHGPISRSPGPRKALCSEMRDAPLRVHLLPVCPGRYSASFHGNALTVILFLLSCNLKKLSGPSVHPTEHTHSVRLETLFHTNGCRVDLGHILNPFHLFPDGSCSFDVSYGSEMNGCFGEKIE